MTAQSRNAIAFITQANQSARHCFPASGMVISIAAEGGRFYFIGSVLTLRNDEDCAAYMRTYAAAPDR
jgi:hypothetical protein